MAVAQNLSEILKLYADPAVERIKLVTLYGQVYEGKIKHLYKDCMHFEVPKLKTSQSFIIPIAAIESIEVRDDISI